VIEFHDLNKLITILAKEREYVRSELIPIKKSLGRRVLTHLVFADCEAISYYLKDCINSDYVSNVCEGNIGTEDWLASSSEEYLIDDKGDIFCSARRVRTLPHLLFVLKYTAKYIGKTFDPKVIAGWEHVKPAFRVRNRITHPKEPKAISITNDDFEHIQALESWFQLCLGQLIQPV
jgi:hypothetical protein